MQAVLLVGAGGAIGAVARYGTGIWFGRMGITGFPWATLAVNIAGSFAMGLLVGYLAQATPPGQAELRLFIAVGVLGGFTTFSAFSLDVVTMLERAQIFPAIGYASASFAFSIIALVAGLLLVRALA